MNTMQLQVRDFMQYVANQPTPTKILPLAEVPLKLRTHLILEEACEFAIAAVEQNRLGAIDALCDLLYVTFGAAIAMGVDIEPFFNEVHRANMAKLGGPKGAHGRHEKPEGWEPPQIEALLERLEGMESVG